MAKRLRDVCKLPETDKLWRLGRGFVVRDLPWTEDRLQKIPPFEFEKGAVIARSGMRGGIPNKVQVGDMGLGDRIFPVGTKPSSDEGMFDRVDGDGFPVQVKQVDKTGRPDVDKFEAVMARENRDRGFFVSFGYTAYAETEVASFFKKTGRIIKLLTVREILDEEHVKKM